VNTRTKVAIASIALLASAGAGTEGYVLGTAAATFDSQTWLDSPASCMTDGGDQISSGDAARFDKNKIFVCTDGTWVHVTGYGR
jgi:hypothetical protein